MLEACDHRLPASQVLEDLRGYQGSLRSADHTSHAFQHDVRRQGIDKAMLPCHKCLSSTALTDCTQLSAETAKTGWVCQKAHDMSV